MENANVDTVPIQRSDAGTRSIVRDDFNVVLESNERQKQREEGKDRKRSQKGPLAEAGR